MNLVLFMFARVLKHCLPISMVVDSCHSQTCLTTSPHIAPQVGRNFNENNCLRDCISVIIVFEWLRNLESEASVSVFYTRVIWFHKNA